MYFYLFESILVVKKQSVKEFLSNYFDYQNNHTKLNQDIPKMPLLDFSSLLGYPEYQFQLKKLYETCPEEWLRPVDLFCPHYSSGILNYILSKYNPDEQKDLKIVEMNGRNGTNAKVILDYLQENYTELYEHTHYYIANPNKAFLERQKRTLTPYHKNVTLIPKNLMNWNIPEEIKSKNTIIMGIEVLDILPHSKVKYNENKGIWEEVYITNGNVEINSEISSHLLEETLLYYNNNKTVENPKSISMKSKIMNLIEKTIKKMKKIRNNDEYKNAVFLPTGSIELIKYINKNIPNHSIIFTNYDSLPYPNITSESSWDGSLAAINAPLVTKDGEDYGSYLLPPGLLEIFFPTDFTLLKMAYENITKKECKVMKTSDFMSNYAPLTLSKTITGYNPLIEDFLNTSFLIS